MKKFVIVALLALGPGAAWGQSDDTPPIPPNVLSHLNDGTPGACDAPMAEVIMMKEIQEGVGSKIGEQLVDLRDIKTDWINADTGDWQCVVTTVWSQGPETRGIFKAYHNVIHKVVYSWDGLQNLPASP